ncbi:MAG: sensor histidine kinase, partial [Bacteroidales bacterium]|nr:sensor histidine kinase [Bacteroidales bacterium]
FTPQGGKIWFIAHTTNGKSEIHLMDSGVGIPQEKIDTLFKSHEKYYTYGTEGEKGSGLGLSITKKILDAHNYTIECKSEPEKGTEFIIRL